MADPQTGTGAGVSNGGIWDFVGPVIQAGAGVYGATSAAGSAAGGYNNAAGITQGALGTSEAALSPYAGAGVPALGALSSLYGLNGQPPNYSSFYNQPGYAFSQQQGDQAIQRAANATGGGFSTTTLGQLSNYNSGLASTYYNNYVNQLYGLASLGLGGASSLGSQAIAGAGQVGQNYVGAGNANASGVAGATGAIIGAAGKLPWQQIGSGISSLFGGGNSGSLQTVTPSLNSSDYATPGYDSSAAGGGFQPVNTDLSDLYGDSSNPQ